MSEDVPTFEQLAARVGPEEAINRVARMIGERLKANIPEGIGFALLLVNLTGPERVNASNIDRKQLCRLLDELLVEIRPQ